MFYMSTVILRRNLGWKNHDLLMDIYLSIIRHNSASFPGHSPDF
jgi:hypothetical protein